MPEQSQTAYSLSATPQTVQEYHERGWIFITQNDFSAAEADFRQAVSKNNRYAEGFFGLGVALKKLARYTDAQEAFENAIAYLGQEAKKEDPSRLTMLRRLARDHIEILQGIS